MEKFIIPENLEKEEIEISPSGRYQLKIQYYKTKQDSWNYTRGIITRIDNGKEVFSMNRNYCTFHHSWLNRRGDELFISGKSYMNQVIVNLDKEEVYESDILCKYIGEDEIYKQFCWDKSYISNDGNTIAVYGCFWGSQRMYFFYDFTDLSKGWYPLKLDGLDTSSQTDIEPEGWKEDGTFTFIVYSSCFVKRDEKLISVYDVMDDLDNDDDWLDIAKTKLTLYRDNDRMRVKEKWENQEYPKKEK